MIDAARRRVAGKCFAFAIAVLVLLPARSLAVNHPFGSHPTAYAAGTILPSHVSQATLDQAVRDFYDGWKNEFLEQACGSGRYVVRAGVGGGNLTVSEAHGYGMMIAALMAGHDPEAHAIFDGMVAYFREHPTATHDHLMSWNQNNSCADVEGNDSASDGDLDIAFALLLADKQWGSCGAIDYAAEALAVLTDVEDGEVDTSGRYVLLGDWVDALDPQYYPATRSSDFMPDHLRSFAAASGDGVWTDIADHTYQVFDDLQTGFSPATGLLPDFVADPAGTPEPVPPLFLEGTNDGAYGYNACRDPWRLGMDFLVAGDARAKTAAQRITSWIRTATGGDPSEIQSGYQLDGNPSPGTDYLSMAFVAPLGVGAMVDSTNQAWLNDVWDLVVATPLSAEGYYENTLKLLAMIAMSGNWWAPESVGGGCVPDSTPICTGGGYVTNLEIKLSGLAAGAGKQKLVVEGSLFVPGSLPGAPDFTDGMQLLIEDTGNGNVVVFDVSHQTTPVPSAAEGVCDARDGWDANSRRTLYKNRSTALDLPTCTPGSSSGLSLVRYKSADAFGLDFLIKARKASIAAPVGPLRVSLVLADTEAAGDAGECGVGTTPPCTSNGKTARCR